jgi:hypothetical protein
MCNSCGGQSGRPSAARLRAVPADSTSYLRPFAPQQDRSASLSDPRLAARRALAGSCERNGVRGSYAPVSWSAAQEVLADFYREARPTRTSLLEAPAPAPVLASHRRPALANRPAAWQAAPGVRYQPATSVQGARWASVVTAVVVLIMGCATGAIMMADGHKLPTAHEDQQGSNPLAVPPDLATTTPVAAGRAQRVAQRHRAATIRRRAVTRKQPTADITTPLPSISWIGPALSHHAPATAPVAAVQGALNGPDSYSVLHLLSRYFGAINTQDFAAYQRLFSSSVRASLSQTDFFTTYGSSRDTQATLQSVRFVSQQLQEANVTYISHQQPVASPTGATCNRWDVTLYLSHEAGQLVIASSPSDNTVAADCL